MLVLALIGLGIMFLLPGGRADKYTYKPTEEELMAAPESTSEALAHIG